MKFYLLFIFIIAIGSCNSNRNSLSLEKLQQDSLAKVIEDSTQLVKNAKDSITLVDQGKVIGDITFGIVRKDFDKKEEEFKDKCKIVDFVGSDGYKFYKYQIGDYRFNQMWANYYNEKLYFARIEGYLIHYEDYKSKMPKQFSAIFEPLRKKYGFPDQYEGIPQWHLTEKGYTYLAAAWNIGEKRLELHVENDGLYFKLNMDIFQPKISEVLKLNKEKEEKNHADSATKLL